MRRLIGALSGVALIAVMATGAVFASHALPGDNVAPAANDHWQVAGNPRCPGDFAFEKKIDDPADGNYGPIHINIHGKFIDWEIRDAYLNTYDANLVIVKGGPTAMIYEYDTWDDEDINLTAPVNPNSGTYYGISHIEFCFDPKAG